MVSITNTAAKFLVKEISRRNKQLKVNPDLKLSTQVADIVEEFDLYFSDEWTHLGFCLLVCLENDKMISSFKSGNNRVFEALIGKVIKLSNSTVDPSFIKELLPFVIERWF